MSGINIFHPSEQKKKSCLQLVKDSVIIQTQLSFFVCVWVSLLQMVENAIIHPFPLPALYKYISVTKSLKH